MTIIDVFRICAKCGASLPKGLTWHTATVTYIDEGGKERTEELIPCPADNCGHAFGLSKNCRVKSCTDLKRQRS